MTVPVLVLQSFAIQRCSPRSCTEQKATCLHVASSPSQIAYSLKAEHRIEDVEGNQREAMGTVRGCGCQPCRERARFVDAFLKHLSVARLAVRGELTGVHRFVQLPFGRVDAQLSKHAFHAERSRFVRDDRHNPIANLPVAQQRRQDAHKGHRGGYLALTGTLKLIF